MISVLLVYRISRNRNKGAYQNGINNVDVHKYWKHIAKDFTISIMNEMLSIQKLPTGEKMLSTNTKMIRCD